MKVRMRFVYENGNSMCEYVYNSLPYVPKVGERILLPNNCVSSGNVTKVDFGYKRKETFINVFYV